MEIGTFSSISRMWLSGPLSDRSAGGGDVLDLVLQTGTSPTPDDTSHSIPESELSLRSLAFLPLVGADSFSTDSTHLPVWVALV